MEAIIKEEDREAGTRRRERNYKEVKKRMKLSFFCFRRLLAMHGR
jgi:hypothetical protein